MNIRKIVLVIMLASFSICFQAQSVPTEGKVLVGRDIVQFIPNGFDIHKTPSLILSKEPVSTGKVPSDWTLTPEFKMENNKASASLKFTGDVSLYGGGEVTGPLLRNGQSITLWNTDTGAYSVDNGKRLYQSHPWVLGVRDDGSSFGILFDSSWKAELHTNSNEIIFNTEGALFRVYIIDRESPRAVLEGLAELTGTIKMPARWTLGYHQSRFSYETEERVLEIANTFREKEIPCDVIWMDIDYMDGFRVFTFNKDNFSDPKALNDELNQKGFHSVYMIDPGVKVDPGYAIYNSGSQKDVWVQNADGEDYVGKVWPGDCVFPDFTTPQTRKWWADLYTDFFKYGMDGIWNDMNEPAINDNHLPEHQRLGTMPFYTPHKGGGDLPPGPHLLYHNAYGRLMVEASYDGIKKANPDKRPFLLTRANLLGGQRYAATWTGDNYASWDHMKLSVPMSLTLGLSGQPFNGPDIGGFLGDTSGDLWAHWLGFGTFFPFARGHACAGTNNKEPWAYGEDIEKSSRISLERRYRLLPYLYTAFYDASTTGVPVMAPLFFADPADLRLRSEEQAFLIGENLLIVPAFAKDPQLPHGIWEKLSVVDGDLEDKYQADLKIKGGSIIPVGKIIQSTTENSFDPLTLIVCLNEKGIASGKLYVDSGDGWDFKNGDYALMTFEAHRKGNRVSVTLTEKQGGRDISEEIRNVNVVVIMNGKKFTSSGALENGIIVSLGPSTK